MAGGWRTGDVIAEYVVALDEGSDRAVATTSGAILDECLRDLLLAFLTQTRQTKDLLGKGGGQAPLESFGARVTACRALGLITQEEHHQLNLVRKIRNRFAHEWRTATFAEEPIKGLVASMGLVMRTSTSPLPTDKDVRECFITAVAFLIFWISTRRDTAAQNRLQEIGP